MNYVLFDGHAVSTPWLELLSAARRAGVKFTLDSGHRTLAEQAWLYNHQPPLAAFPSPTAPHVRIGRWDHAVDINASDGGAERFRQWARRQGVTLTYTVSGEPWHLETQTDFRRRFPLTVVLKGGATGAAVRQLVGDLMWLGYLPYPVLGRPRSYFGGWVNTAVKRFQRDYHLRSDGVVGPDTARAVKRAVANRRAHGYKPKRTSPLRRV